MPKEKTSKFRFSSTVRNERMYMGLSAKELADKIGIHENTLLNIETNKTIPNTTVIIKLAEFFNMKVNELFTFES